MSVGAFENWGSSSAGGVGGVNRQSVTTILEAPSRVLNSLAELMFLVFDIVDVYCMVFVESYIKSPTVLPGDFDVLAPDYKTHSICKTHLGQISILIRSDSG